MNKTDEGYFGRDSISWRLFADPSSKLGGVVAILLQSLNPMMMRLFSATSNYEEDVSGRSERTNRYIDTITFGDKAHADAAAASVQRMHAHAVWVDPRTGEELRADNEEWLAWTHNSVVYGVILAAEAFGPYLTGAEKDQFVREQLKAAELAGISDHQFLPTSYLLLQDYIEENKSWMALTLPAADISRALRKPTLRGNPVEVFIAVNVQDGIISLLPDWALLLFGIEGRPMNLRAAQKVTRRIIARARKHESTDAAIERAVSSVQTHPYRRVRKRAVKTLSDNKK